MRIRYHLATILIAVICQFQPGVASPAVSKQKSPDKQPVVVHDTKIWMEAIKANRLRLSSDNLNRSTFHGQSVAAMMDMDSNMRTCCANYLQLRIIIPKTPEPEATKLKALAVDFESLIRSTSGQLMKGAMRFTNIDSEHAQYFAQEAFEGYFVLDEHDPHLEPLYKIWYANWTHNEQIVREKAARYK